MEQTAVSILSLVVALLAVFVGPLVTWLVTKQQLESAERVAQRNLIGPIRQTWINDVRARLAEFIALAHQDVGSRRPDSSPRMWVLAQELLLMLSPDTEPTHKELLDELAVMIELIEKAEDLEPKALEPIDDVALRMSYAKAVTIGRVVLRNESQRVENRKTDADSISD